MIEFSPRPTAGRAYKLSRPVRLSDAGPDGVLRLDGVARYLQDVAGDDWADSGLDPRDTWVVRRTALRLADGGRWPALGEMATLTTWCSGAGPAWAERRTDIELDDRLMVEAVALWVPLDSSGHPLRLGKDFYAVYGDAVAGRRVSGRVQAASVPKRRDDTAVAAAPDGHRRRRSCEQRGRLGGRDRGCRRSRALGRTNSSWTGGERSRRVPGHQARADVAGRRGKGQGFGRVLAQLRALADAVGAFGWAHRLQWPNCVESELRNNCHPSRVVQPVAS